MQRQVEGIRIDDLAEPHLSAEQLAMRELAEGFVVDFEPESILEAAKRKSGLDDFGPMDFVERLTILCRAVDDDTGLHASGRARVYLDLVRYATNRLRIQDLLTDHPEIHDERIDRPVIVAGLPRSGTTHLVNLLAADHRFRALPLWECREPIPVPGEQPTVEGEDPRYTRSRLDWEQADELTPLLKLMHPMTPDHIHEELELMCPDFASYNFEWLFDAPAWRDHYLATDQAPHYCYMRTALKLLQWQDVRRGEPRRRWVMKCPQHLEQLPVLLDAFPDATIVITHRDPTSVIASAATMSAYGDRMRRVRPDPPAVATYWADRVEKLLASCVRDRAVVPADRSLDVLFHEFMADDLGTVRRIYDLAGVEMTGEAVADFSAYLAAHPRGLHGQIIYDLQADFGIDREELRERFRSYIDRFGVRPEADR